MKIEAFVHPWHPCTVDSCIDKKLKIFDFFSTKTTETNLDSQLILLKGNFLS